MKVENHRACGNDKLFIIDGNKENGDGAGQWFKMDFI